MRSCYIRHTISCGIKGVSNLCTVLIALTPGLNVTSPTTAHHKQYRSTHDWNVPTACLPAHANEWNHPGIERYNISSLYLSHV